MLLVSDGRYNKEIARELRCEENTIKKHLQHIFTKPGVQNRIEATIRFRELNLKTGQSNIENLNVILASRLT